MARGSDVHLLPLRPPVYHILLALVGRDRHGLGIAEEVERASEGLSSWVRGRCTGRSPTWWSAG